MTRRSRMRQITRAQDRPFEERITDRLNLARDFLVAELDHVDEKEEE